MLDFVFLISRFFANIFGLFGSIEIPYGGNFSGSTNIGGILFACIVIGFVVSVFWKGAKSQ